MNKAITIFLTLLAFSCRFAVADDNPNIIAKETDQLYRVGAGSEDGAYTALSASMIGWGVGLTVGIALLAGLLHQSHAAHAHSD